MILLTLFCIFATVKSEIHDLHYIYTALSKPISQSGVYQFTAMEILNGRATDFCNSTDKVKMPMQKWMEEQNEKDYSKKGTESRRRMEQWFDLSIKILMDHMRQNKPDVHILQWMYGCQAEKTTDGNLTFLNGFDQYGYDGEVFLAFDTPPEVYLFSKKSSRPDYQTLVCLATGFYPKDVVVDILKNGVPLAGVNSSEVRPNGDRKETYQLRKWLEVKASDTSKYSCRIQHRTLPVPIEEFWDGKCRNCDGDNTGAIVGGVVVVLLIVLVTVPVVLYFLRRRNNASQAHVNGLNHPLNGVRTGANGSNGSVESRGSGKGSTDSDEPKEVTEPLVANASQAHVNGLNHPLNGVRTGANGSNGSVESRGSGKGSTDSDEPKEVTEPLVANAAQAPANQPLTEVNPETNGSNGSVESWDSGRGSTDSDESKDVTKPFINEEGKQQPQLEAAEVV